ncbi:MAG: filamentous hemagglutinin N-terminal domain-containing protein [Aphanocapsa sp. GSE-SYN-MK-11-07L]|jgi:filamentous hemagglutinin family protein|nr:filamentous hemagglutinin N-terminal domain-containing protein [Aphanocapsa sp. GSE-SYN-MK-11-07L]
MMEYQKTLRRMKIIIKLLSSGLLFSIILHSAGVKAQIQPDLSLPNPTQITINGGTNRGANLFHSFSNFSVLTEQNAYFNNSNLIQNIIVRVSGASSSSIFGSLTTNGSANFFLLNPNGISFGPKAQLNVGGSFIATTAQRIEFADGTYFVANPGKTNDLLSNSIPIGLRFSGNPNPITVVGEGNNILAFNYLPIIRNSNNQGLQVKPKNTLALIGGDVFFKGGIASANAGSIEISGVQQGQVGFKSSTQGLTFDYDRVSRFGNISLTSASLVDASGSGLSSIRVVGNHISLRDGSLLLIQSSGESGAINIDAKHSLFIEGSTPSRSISSGLWSETIGLSDGGNIKVLAPQLILENSGQIYTATYGSGSAGRIDLIDSEFLKVSGGLIGSFTLGSGRGGDIGLTTDKLLMDNGGSILAGSFAPSSTLAPEGSGNVNVQANVIELKGTLQENDFPTSISAATFSGGPAGNVVINSDSLQIINGARIDSSTGASGASGNVTISVNKSIDVIGKDSLIIASGNQVSTELQDLLNLPPSPSGNSGNVSVTAPQISITNGGQLSVRNDGTGSTGNLAISANSITLNNGNLTAATASGDGGNINIDATSLLLLKNQSSITASAKGQGQGGNITINSPVLALVEGSNISANAEQSIGGRILITTTGLFSSPDSQITATSQLGSQFNGIVEINTPDINLLTQPELGFKLNIAKLPLTCIGQRGTNLSVITASDLDKTDDQLEAIARANNIPMFLDGQGRRRPLIEVQGWIPNGDGTARAIAVVETSSPSSSIFGTPCLPADE